MRYPLITLDALVYAPKEALVSSLIFQIDRGKKRGCTCPKPPPVESDDCPCLKVSKVIVGK